MSKDIATAALLRNARMLIEAAVDAVDLLPKVTRAQKPHIEAMRTYTREALAILDTVIAGPANADGGQP